MTSISNRSLPDEARSYLHSLEIKGRQPSTINRYAYDLEDFFLWIRAKKHTGWQTLTGDEIEEYLSFLQENKDYSTRTIDRIFTVLKRFYAHFLKQGIVPDNPVANVGFHHEDIEKLAKTDFISEKEAQQLFHSIPSPSGLSESQQPSRKYLNDRNLAIVTLFLHYGLTLQELVALHMNDTHFEKGTLDISSVSSVSRTVDIQPVDIQLLYSYYKTIPQAVQPYEHSQDPLFVAFDFARNTYRWDYSTDAPKALTEIAVQKMIRQEVQRAGLRKGISARHLRRTYILNMLERGESMDTIQSVTGLKTRLSLKRYIEFASPNQNPPG